jgi:serine/threonine-protein kinase
VPEPSPATELPTVDGYRVVAELGSGSLASVYKAIDGSLGRTVALKILRSTIAPRSPFAAQLEREARMLSLLCHPNVGQLHSFVKTDTRMYLVLEFVDGVNLSTLLKRRPSLPPDCVAAIGARIARGLAHAHERGIVHGSVKPAHILVSRHGEVKIFDFGIAQRSSAAEEPVLLEDMAAFGTPAYMSPEQILGGNVDARSDIFSLGVVLYELICGARPFTRGDEAESPTAHRIRRDAPIPLHRRAPDVPAVLERVVMRAIEKLPGDRFPTARAMAERLEELTAGRTGMPQDKVVVRALVLAGLVPSEGAGSTATPKTKERSSVRRASSGVAMLGAMVFVGGGALQATAQREGQAAGARPLELAPASAGYLRVLATPWAEVWIDGQLVDVTPVARAIPLSPRTHYVTLVHPNAPVEKRTIAIASGETRTVDVLMAISDPSPKEEPAPPPTGANTARP